MSTRSATIVTQRAYTSIVENETEELFRFYRHCDGYPEGHGMDMATAFVEAERKGTADRDRWYSSGLNNRNWVQKCFAELFAKDCDLEVEAKGNEHGDIEYLYVVEGASDHYGGKHNVDESPVVMRVYEAYGHTDYDDILAGEPIFDGKPQEFVDKFGGR